MIAVFFAGENHQDIGVKLCIGRLELTTDN